MTRTHPQYRVIFWMTFAINFVLVSPLALWLVQRESDRLIASLVVAGLNIFSSFWMASIVPYLFTRSELKRLIESQLKEQPVA